MTTDENNVQPVPSRYRSASVRELQRSVRELQAARDTWREHWRQLMRDHEAVVTERDELEAENERLRAENERLLDDLKQERRSHRGAHDAGVATLAERDAAREQVRELQAECLRVDEANTRLGEQVRQRDEVIERVRVRIESYGRPFHSRACGFEDCTRCVLEHIQDALEGDGR